MTMVAWGTPPAAQRPGHPVQIPLSPSGENPVGLMQMQFGSRYRRCRAETCRRRSRVHAVCQFADAFVDGSNPVSGMEAVLLPLFAQVRTFGQ